jgi:predicted outer membrane repeat protein
MTFTVTNLSDALKPPPGLDLRQAIAAANADPGSTILFGAGVNGTITLRQGDLDITAPVTISAGGQTIAVSGAGRDRVFDINTPGRVSLIDLTVEDGRAPVTEGGGVFDANPASTLVLTNDQVLLNVASGTGSGGGVYSKGMVVVESTTVEGNSAPGNGGGVFAAKTLTVSGSTISDNVAGLSGGGLYEAGPASTVQLGLTSVLHNRASDGNGGGVWARSDINANGLNTVSNNVAFGNGGGLYSDAGNVTVFDSTDSGNTATGKGGGAFADFNAFLDAATVNNNVANGGGGGVWADDGFVSVMSSSTVSGNTAGAGSAGAGANGGGVWAATDVLVTTGSTVANNTANGDGGGLFALRSVSIDGSTISGNAAASTSAANGNGGGIFAADVTVAGGTVSGNSADRSGGGIHATGTVLLVAPLNTVSGNSAGSDGGGIWDTGGNVDIALATVTANTAGHNGGGVFVSGGPAESGSLVIDFINTVSNNVALNEGGGVFVGHIESATIQGTILGNTAGFNGGGVSAHDVVNLSLTSAVLVSNSATAGSGGGVYAVGLASNVVLDSDLFLGNTAGASGGGVYFRRVSATVNFVQFDNNVSFGGPTTGSALFADTGAAVDLNNSFFHDTQGASAQLHTELIDVGRGGSITSSGGNHVIDSSWVHVTGFSPALGDVPNGL